MKQILKVVLLILCYFLFIPFSTLYGILTYSLLKQPSELEIFSKQK